MKFPCFIERTVLVVFWNTRLIVCIDIRKLLLEKGRYLPNLVHFEKFGSILEGALVPKTFL